MKMSEISNESLLRKTRELVQGEREITLSVLHHLREIERRHLFAELGYSSLYEYAVAELKYSNGAAHRRIASMRLLKALPDIEEKIESGALSLCSLSQAHSFFRIEKTGSSDDKRDILLKLENKSKREVEKELIKHSTQAELHYQEKARVVTASHTELKLLVETQFTEGLEELRGLLAHSQPNASIKDLLHYSLNLALAKHRPKAAVKVERVEPSPPVEMGNVDDSLSISTQISDPEKRLVRSAKPARSRCIPKEIKRQVWQRDRGQCTYQHNGKMCASRYGLEFDHIQPFAVGGEARLENLRLRCRAHNQLEAIKLMGQQKMAQFIPRLQ